MSTTQGRYVPPHLRNREPPIAGPSRIPPTPSNRESREWSSAPARNSRTPWANPSPSQEDPSALHPVPNMTDDTLRSPALTPVSQNPWNRNAQSAPSRQHARNGSTSVSPTLHVFGDSFTGPLKLLSDENAKITTFKGSSAKGLNNPNSIKQVSKDLLPALNSLLAPPPYAYTPSAGRWALLIFGNVDLQINYLWQLQNKPISNFSFPAPSSSANGHIDTDEAESSESNGSSSVLATATETSLRGPALGPELFVETVAKAYISWLEREIIKGPIGERIRSRTNASEQGRRQAPGKILIAAALPPLVEDDILPRIPEKYVERLEEDHAKAQKAMQIGLNPERISRTPWAKQKDEDMEDGVSTVTTTDEVRPGSPRSSASSNWSSGMESTASNGTNITVPSTPPSAKSQHSNTKTSMESLLQHEPPLCTLPIRIHMTNYYNTLVSAFCAEHPDVLSFVDITKPILDGNVEPVSTLGSADRSVWACPVDPTNIHPLWEPTLPLWLEELKRHGVPTDNYRISTDAEETFKAYEVDKRRRVANSGRGDDPDGTGRIKLRDE